LNRRQAVEVVWPYVVGIVSASIIALLSSRLRVPREIKEVFEYTASTAGVFAGFMLAAASILASIGDRPFIRQARRAGVYASLIGHLFTAMRWSIGVAVLSLPAILFDPQWRLPWYGVGIWVWAFVAFTALSASIRALRTFTKMMRYVSDD
jgi:hypothetical protein